MSHTAGPWTLRKIPCDIGCCDDLQEVQAQYPDDVAPGRYRPIASVNGGNAVWLYAGEAKANAYLIAAAPELLEACKAAVADASGAVNPKARLQNYEQMQAAITKAEGKESHAQDS